MSEIDFDEASRAWRANKKKVGNGFQYCCGEPKKNGEPCKAPPKIWSDKKAEFDFSRHDGWGPCTKHKVKK